MVDDGSLDGTGAVAQDYCRQDSRVHLIKKENGGSASAVNLGLLKAKSDFVIRLDADDELLPAYSSVLAPFITSHPEFDIYASNAFKVYQNGRKEIYHKAPRFSSVLSLDIEDMIQACQIYGTAAVRTSLFARIGSLNENRVTAEDYDFWIRAVAQGARHIYTPEPLALYRMAPGQKTENVIRSRKADISILESLIDSDFLTKDQIALAEKKIASLKKNVAFRESVTSLVGPKFSKPLFNVMHKAAWLIRPHRRK